MRKNVLFKFASGVPDGRNGDVRYLLSDKNFHDESLTREEIIFCRNKRLCIILEAGPPVRFPGLPLGEPFLGVRSLQALSPVVLSVQSPEELSPEPFPPVPVRLPDCWDLPAALPPEQIPFPEDSNR